ncbi:MAG: hypothetical protein V4574_04430 [Pseudomonadota bacterium]
MPRPAKTLTERLDAAAGLTGIPKMVGPNPDRRHHRWLPVFALTLAYGGFVYGLARPHASGYGQAAILFAYAFACWLPFLGPVKPWRGAEIADEFDRAVRNRAYLAALGVTAGTGWLGLWLVIALALLGNWTRDVLIQLLVMLAFLLPVIWTAAPTLHASWATRPLADDE